MEKAEKNSREQRMDRLFFIVFFINQMNIISEK
jgi:hypothetical protein